MSDPRYPVGKFTYSNPPDEAQRRQMIGDIEQAPTALRAAIKGFLLNRSKLHIAKVAGRCGKWCIMCPRAT